MSAPRLLAYVGRLSRKRGDRFARRCFRCRGFISARDRVGFDAGETVEGVDTVVDGICQRCGSSHDDPPPRPAA